MTASYVSILHHVERDLELTKTKKNNSNYLFKRITKTTTIIPQNYKQIYKSYMTDFVISLCEYKQGLLIKHSNTISSRMKETGL